MKLGRKKTSPTLYPTKYSPGPVKNFYYEKLERIQTFDGRDSIDIHGDYVTHGNMILADSGHLSYQFREQSLGFRMFYNACDSLLNKARELGGDQPEILINLGILSAWRGDLNKAEEFFTQANATNHNKATLSIRKGDYRSASRYYRGQHTYNAALVNLLNGNNNIDFECVSNGIKHKEEDCYYLHAIEAARSGNLEMIISNLKEAIASDNPYYRYLASKDLEFEKYRDTEEFKSLFEIK